MDFSKLMLDTAKNELKEVSKEKANAKIREKFNAILGIENGCNRKALRRAIQRHRLDIYEIIEDTVENMLVSGWGENPFFKDFVDLRNLSDGDENEFFTKDNTILTVSEISGNHHALIRQKLGFGEAYRVKTGWYGVKIYGEYELFMAGKLDWAEFIQKIYEAFDNKLNSMVYSSLMSAGTKLPNQPQFNITSQLNAATKDTLITLVEDVQTATGKEAVIMGTKSALSKLNAVSETDWISDQMKEERHTLGRLGIWEGIRLVEIPQVFAANDTTKKLVDNSKLLIMPLADNKFIKVVNEGDAQIKEVTESANNADRTIEYEYQQKMGVGVVIGYLFGVWTITV